MARWGQMTRRLPALWGYVSRKDGAWVNEGTNRTDQPLQSGTPEYHLLCQHPLGLPAKYSTVRLGVRLLLGCYEKSGCNNCGDIGSREVIPATDSVPDMLRHMIVGSHISVFQCNQQRSPHQDIVRGNAAALTVVHQQFSGVR